MFSLIESVMNHGTSGIQVSNSSGSKPQTGKASFGEVLKSAIDAVNESQYQSDLKTEALANGNADNLHDVMITAQKASITLETAVQMQKKAIDAYNEIMRMQV